MNGAGDDPCRELVPDAWRELDDTLADGPSPAAVPPAAKAWLADQRFVHGLLRALHTADAAAREGRIAAILARIDAGRAAEPRRRWLAVAAAAALLAVLGIWALSPPALPTAEAAVARVVAELARDVARRFHVAVVGTDARGVSMQHHEFELLAQSEGRFRVTGRFGFGGFQSGEMTVGCDGNEFWLSSANGLFRHAVPVADRERLLQGFGEVFEFASLDVHDLVRRLPEDFELTVAGREPDAAGRSLLRIEAVRKRQQARARQNAVSLLYDERTGMVARMEVEFEFARGASRRLSIEHRGDQPALAATFARPW
jgi:hypothetical protein